VTYRWIIATLAPVVLLGGCSTSGNTSGASIPSSGTSIRMISRSTRMGDQPGSLYISSLSGIAVYGGQPLKYLRTISDGVLFPDGIAFNPNKQLFVANHGDDTVTVYEATERRPVRALSKGLKLPFKLAVSSANDVYVLGRKVVSLFENGRQTVAKTIRLSAVSIAIDSTNNVYLGTYNAIGIYAPRAIKRTRTIAQGVDGPAELAIDTSGNLYVANDGPAPDTCGNISVYAAITGTLENTITDGICEPVGLAFDSAWNLYVGNYGDDDTKKPSVTVYAVGTSALMETIESGITKPIALAVDPSNNLYVANDSAGAGVKIYPAGHKSPTQTLSKGISDPLDLKWLP
jgi:sugar lactone lactonase YvrE